MVVVVGVELIFFFDIIINFLLEYKDEIDYKPVRDIKKIALRYLKGQFIVDFLATVPLRFIFWYWPIEYLTLLQLLKLFRISKFTSVVDEKNF